MSKERFDNLNVAEPERFCKGLVKVWAGIGVNGKNDLYIVENGTLTAVRCSNKILDQFVKPYTEAIGPDLIMMDHNPRLRAPVSDAFVECETIVYIDWPA